MISPGLPDKTRRGGMAVMTDWAKAGEAMESPIGRMAPMERATVRLKNRTWELIGWADIFIFLLFCLVE